MPTPNSTDSSDSWIDGPWVGFDLDGTLFRDDTGQDSVWHIGPPIAARINHLQYLLELGYTCKIVTARVGRNGENNPNLTNDLKLNARLNAQAFIEGQIKLINNHMVKIIGRTLPITCEKDFNMLVLFDDRAIGVEPNTGRIYGNVQESRGVPCMAPASLYGLVNEPGTPADKTKGI